jgi:3-keto-L-gulonate-6-phosphate decarboxylase
MYCIQKKTSTAAASATTTTAATTTTTATTATKAKQQQQQQQQNSNSNSSNHMMDLAQKWGTNVQQQFVTKRRSSWLARHRNGDPPSPAI